MREGVKVRGPNYGLKGKPTDFTKFCVFTTID
jgi:hypothetical protein